MYPHLYVRLNELQTQKTVSICHSAIAAIGMSCTISFENAGTAEEKRENCMKIFNHIVKKLTLSKKYTVN
jgi:hypothetical protein